MRQLSERAMRELSFSASLWTEGVNILAAFGCVCVCVCVYKTEEMERERLHFGRLQFIQME